MSKYSKADKLAYHIDRIKRELNPCPGRTAIERQFITRCLHEIAHLNDHHLERLLRNNNSQPLWLHEGYISPSSEQDAVESIDAFQDAKRDDDGYIIDMHDQNQRATNRVRIATWYKNADENLYMIVMIAVSPLECEVWGALPLTLAQWRIIIAGTTTTHMRWKWVHAVRQHWGDDTYQVGNTLGWYMDSCKKLDKVETDLCTGQAIYAHVVTKYLEYVQTRKVTECR